MTASLSSRALGLGLRPQHYQDVLNQAPAVDFFEVLSENYMNTGGRPLQMLDRIAERHPVVLHGVSMNVAGTDRLDRAYLRELKALAQRCRARWISDHLSWCAVDGVHLHDLLPIPYTERALRHVAARVEAIQHELGCALVLENPSTYVQFDGAEFGEAEFLAALVERTGCELLVDVNNVFVSGSNHDFDPEAWLRAIPWRSVRYFHMAGHTVLPTHRLDTHDQPVCDEVVALHTLAQRLSRPTVLERDDAIPPFAELVAELRRVALPASAQLRGVAS
jgi:uncharacterized protein